MENDLSDENIKKISSYGLLHSFKKRENIIIQGEISNNIYLILNGYVSLTLVSNDGQEHLIGFCGKGTWINEYAYFNESEGIESIYTVESATAVVCVEFNLSQLDLILDDYEVLYSIEKGLVRKCTLLEQKIKISSLFDTTECITWVLIKLMEIFGDNLEDGILIKFNLTRQTLAQLSGTSIGAVNIFMKKYINNGYISRHNIYLLIKNPDYFLSQKPKT